MSAPLAPPGGDGPLAQLRRYTPARIGLGRAGPSLPTREVLALALAHARARDAVHALLDLAALDVALRAMGVEAPVVRSAAPERAAYLARPDLGRRLSDGAAEALPRPAAAPAVAVVVADGLSAVAAQRHAPPLLGALRSLAPERWEAAPVVVALQARVALGDAVGAALGARLVAVLIGERPGLSSPDSLGVYLTSDPRPGRSDAERNCVSNIRPEGLPYGEAARRIDWLAREALARGGTGVALKDESDASASAGRQLE
ncbi:ethanolamine ammonia-lyase subunit EutC [Anaeromyxobacter diazotrophicus]|uniref:Ethanolamine ammonia-lyase small subunit n=1 Tax=Anaeromyxobacter diazotrophicus TaxID=2590199 RepID=A0A7I9VRM8_9BACT|nr:ethanolamine ammonia-lyase subunit EutC [Anaeromyxobacter diazotrophicus]GEJ59086.1 ethanolamine ammonia-lyase light chain [Anaeromyxobacter diazotrophicus]